ncbi:hypothetical protein KFU94_39420 [Chloroflexi bacterium TSY]|nr:hypothetical protein [Chloroflexi bacterium TSY]
MPHLQIDLIGSPTVQEDEKPLTGFVSSKATALVYFLATTNRPHSRDYLAELFWEGESEQRRKKNLRDVYRIEDGWRGFVDSRASERRGSSRNVEECREGKGKRRLLFGPEKIDIAKREQRIQDSGGLAVSFKTIPDFK